MFDDKTPESIKAEILAQIPPSLDTREGSFLNDMISPVAMEIWKLYESMNGIIPMVYIDETSGVYIDKKADMYGIKRKLGKKATAVLDFTGANGTVIPKDRVFLSTGNLEFVLNEAVTITAGRGSGKAVAAEVGAEYNLVAGEIKRQYENLTGLDTVTSAPATGGVDGESDKALTERLYEHLRRPATSGNANHYLIWAKEVEGVGAAKVTPLPFGAGTVGVLIVDQNRCPVSADVVAAVVAHIELKRPIGATVTVESAVALPINVAATIKTDGSITAENIKAAWQKSLGEYIRQMAFEKYELLYNRVAFMLLDIQGVVDYSAITVNGLTGNIAIGANQVPTLGTVTVTC
ncbi:MAG: baseplate J/gp47 family protein [Angelakisella sp.]